MNAPTDFFAAAAEIVSPRPPVTAEPLFPAVTHEAPVCFEAGYRRDPEKRPHPDYGCVFWQDNSDYQGRKFAYFYSRDGWRFCMSGRGDVVTEGWLNIGGRSFRIAGPSNAQVRSAA